MKLTLKSSLFLACMLALAACTLPKTPAQSIYQLQGDYNAAVSLETKYDKLPDCGIKNAPVLCSKIETKKLIRQVDDAAYDALMDAQTIVRSDGTTTEKAIAAMGSAQSAILAFSSIVAGTGVK